MAAQWLVFPTILGGTIALAIALIAPLGAAVAVAVAQTAGLLAIAAAERVWPHRPAWNRSHGDVGTDALHAVFSGLGTTQLMRPVALYLGGLGAAALSGAVGARLWPAAWPLPAQLALALVVAEFPQYWLHRWQHRYEGLWRFHAVHHSAPRLYWLNAARFHPLDLGLLYLVGYLPLVLLGCGEEVILLFALFDGVFGMLQHSNVAVRLGPLNWIFSMAEPHRWHHSRTLVEANTNYGSNLIVWDLVFGTFFLPRDREPPEAIGIAGLPDFPRGYLAQLAAPFRWARLRAGAAAALLALATLAALPAPARAACGDGVVEAGEECDDGNDSDADPCGTDCNRILCGDGIVEAGEECDDGNRADEDGCSPFCTLASGPYGVGYVDVAFTYFSEPFGQNRVIEARVWYPAADAPPPGTTVETTPREVPAAAGRFPVLLQSHGFGTPGFATVVSDPRGYHFARHGYVVAAPYHPGDDLAVFPQALAARPVDLRLLLDRLLEDATVPAVLRGHLDADRVGAFGQSLGGITVTATGVNGFFGSVRDPRVKAVLGTGSENYLFTAEQLATLRVPIMLLIGDRDEFFSGSASIRDTWARHQAPRFLVEIAGGDHSTPRHAGTCALPWCSRLGALRYPLAFFGAYLRNDGAALLDAGAEDEFGAVYYARDPGPAIVLGGTAESDCLVTLATAAGDGLGDPAPRALACADGAPCDGDPTPGRCGFDLRLCINVVDRRLLACTPSDVSAIRVKTRGRRAELAALADAATALVPTADRRCTDAMRITVSRGRRLIRVRAEDSSGRRDVDATVLRCTRP